MTDFLDELTMEQLNCKTQLLAETLGMDAFKRMLRVYDGTGNLHIPSLSTLTAPIRNEHLYEDYMRGASILDLAAKYELGESMIRKIIKEEFKSNISNHKIAKGEKA